MPGPAPTNADSGGVAPDRVARKALARHVRPARPETARRT